MANIMDYLTWRADIPFSQDPFNIVDSLVLSYLAYTDFDGIISHADEEMSIDEVYERYFYAHTKEEILARTTFYRLSPLLLEQMAGSVRFRDLILSRYINEISVDKQEQVSAITYWVGDGTTYVAYRGTDNTLIGWKEDFNLSYMDKTAGQERAVSYLNESMYGGGEKIRVGGHSKGGNFAVYASVYCKKQVSDRIVQVYSNDGPGFRERVTSSKRYMKLLPRIVSVIPESSMVGMMLENDYEHHIVKSTETGFMQHDPLSWQVIRNRFEETQSRSDMSIFFDRTLKTWLSGIPDEERASFVDSLFSLIDAPGLETLQDLEANKLKAFAEVMDGMRHLPRERQKEFAHILTGLVKSGQKTLLAGIQERFAAEEKGGKVWLPHKKAQGS